MSLDLAHRVAAELGMNLDSVGTEHARLAVGRALATAAASTDLRRALIDSMTVPESWFFREPKAFEVLREKAVRTAGTFRVLCAPCARGEEAWSSAMTLALTGRPLDAIEVVGVDVSQAALQHAREGRYEKLSLRGDVDDRIAPWTTTLAGGSVSIGESLRRCVRFEEVNLTSPLPWARVGGRFDVVFCRNLMVYLTEPAREQLLENLEALLAPNGILIAASADASLFLRFGFSRTTGGQPFVLVPSTSALARRSSIAPAARRASRPPVAPPEGLRAPARIPAPRVPAIARFEPPQRPAPPEAHREADFLADLDHARSLADIGLHDEALARVRDLRTQHGDRAAFWELEAALHSARDELAEATAALLHAFELEPHRADVLMQLASISERRGRHDVARTYRDRAIALRGGGR